MQPFSEVATSSPRGPSYDRPDWVILGTPQPNGQVMVLASKKLTRAELEASREEMKIDLHGYVWGFDKPKYFLRVEMSDWIVIVADTYEQAFRALFESWSPDSERPVMEGDKP